MTGACKRLCYLWNGLEGVELTHMEELLPLLDPELDVGFEFAREQRVN